MTVYPSFQWIEFIKLLSESELTALKDETKRALNSQNVKDGYLKAIDDEFKRRTSSERL